MEKSINVHERLEALMTRRQLRNPGLKHVRERKLGTVKWNDMIMTPIAKLRVRG